MRTAVTRADRYSIGAIWFHWIIASLVLTNLFIGLFHETLLDGVAGAMPLHKAVGVTVLVLTIGRIGWRLTHVPPPFPSTLPAWEQLTAKTVRTIFYALLLIMPLSGWAMVSASKHPHPISWFGLFDVPLLPVSRAIGGTAHETHELLGFLFVALVVLHIAGALRHQFILRDSVLGRMIPGVAPRD